MPETVLLDAPLSAAQIVRVAQGAPLALSPAAAARIRTARAIVDVIIQREIRGYGINTGVGALCDVIVCPDEQSRLSHNILFSHSCGVGDPLSRVQARAVMAAQINNFAHGRSGIRPEVVDTLLALLNADLLPVIPSRGSVGYITHAAAIGLVLIGAGEVMDGDRRIPATEALHRVGQTPLVLRAKEGLSLVNGTPCATGLACIAHAEAVRLLDWADAAAGFCQGILGRQSNIFDPEGMALRQSQGLRDTAARIRAAVAGTEYHDGIIRTQDPMSLRAVPQIHGAARDGLAQIAQVIDEELRSATDNPLIGGDTEQPQVYSQAHAVGSGMGFAMDQLAILVAQIAATSERRIDRLVNPLVSGLPAFLSAESGVGSGFMIAQYTAVSLVSENRRLSLPASLDGGITSALQEDVLPHATPAAEKALRIVANLRVILAIELLCAAQAAELSTQTVSLGAPLQRLHDWVRKAVPFYADDRPLNRDIMTMAGLIAAQNGDAPL
ncbi:HAL/PAL/TAL family ammonia-lyase [Paracoccus shanxieyensis]|uniref:Histidine ammonia-lyase n=1 Tax=Paracoccus shanxieyensis TaxID=2675752 RepID=A0A6L6IZM9_9RHOB|nr:histidine ammonia-lyase [Paracoccus shanxieyensis]MTH65038.1 histidine ammonia-lyase [Paracoccus shanxieyensis]MTH88058.1 histidine ammonia-lyase [Paracoccus shanxieyensis]